MEAPRSDRSEFTLPAIWTAPVAPAQDVAAVAPPPWALDAVQAQPDGSDGNIELEPAQGRILRIAQPPCIGREFRRGQGANKTPGINGNSSFVGIRRLQEDAVKIYDLYYWEEVLQEEGDGGKVVACRRKNSGSSNEFNCIMKIRAKRSFSSFSGEQQFRELQWRMLNFPPHPGVVRWLEVLEDDLFFYVVMDRARGGSLLRNLSDDFPDGVVPATTVRRLMKQILEAVSHVHRNGLLHRDIKPDNLVMQLDRGKAISRQVMLIDFDHADPYWRGGCRSVTPNTIYGTLRFNAPETFAGHFSAQSDLYSVGVLFYLLMTGKLPYDDAIFDESPAPRDTSSIDVWRVAIHQRLRCAAVDWECSPWPERAQCKEFCKQLLALDPKVRPASADEVLAHDWFRTLEDC